MANTPNTTLNCYCTTEKQKQYYAKRLEDEFGNRSRGMLIILHERYGSWANPGTTRIMMEGNDE